MNKLEVICKKYHEAYKEHYQGILSDEILEQRNGFMEDFIRQACIEYAESVVPEVLFSGDDYYYMGYEDCIEEIEANINQDKLTQGTII